MFFEKDKRVLKWFRGVCLVLLMATAQVIVAEDFHVDSAGARVGGSFGALGAEFAEADAFLNWALPWRWDVGREGWLQTRLDLSAGWLGDRRTDAFIGTVGPSIILGRDKFPVSLEAGVSPTIISRYQFATRDLGTLFQFTSHFGLNVDILSNLRVGYRFQHMSNAGISHSNPGLNLHMIGVSYLF